MPVASTYDYRGEVRDAAANFHGNQVTYVNWKRHLMFCAPLAFPFPPDMPFGAIVEAVRRLSDAGVGVDDLALRRPTLDDVFLTLTGHAAEDAAADGAGDGAGATDRQEH